MNGAVELGVVQRSDFGGVGGVDGVSGEALPCGHCGHAVVMARHRGGQGQSLHWGMTWDGE